VRLTTRVRFVLCAFQTPFAPDSGQSGAIARNAGDSGSQVARPCVAVLAPRPAEHEGRYVIFMENMNCGREES